MNAELSWFEGTPANWPIVRTKFLFKRQQRPVREIDDIVTAFRDGQVALRRNRRTDGFTNAAKEIGYQGIRKGDLVVHAMDAFAGAVGVAEDDGKSTPVYSVCTPKRVDIFTPYYARLLRHMALSGFVESLSKGIRERSTEFRWAELSNVALPVPPADHQERIADFLDEQTARIDALIVEKERLRRSLEEFRLSAIHVALSIGLNREASTVDTGDEWFARVPAHWAFCPLNYRYEVQLGKMLDEKRITGAHLLPYLRNTDVQWDRINSESLPEMDIAPTEMPRYSVRAGDLLVCEGGEVGRAAIWEGPENTIGYQKALHRVRPRTTGDVPRFLFYALFDSAKRGRFESRDKATIAHLTAEAFRRYRFTFPPYAEQTAIVQHLDSLTSKIDGLQRHCIEHIDRLREYRSSLISAAVTGQLDINSYKEAA